MSIQAATSASLATASRAAMLPFLYPAAARCSAPLSTKSSSARRFASTSSSVSLYAPSSSRPVLYSKRVATSSRWLSTSVSQLSPASSSKAQLQNATHTSTSSSSNAPPFASSSSSSSSQSRRADKSDTASVDPACATLSPSSPASPKSQKDPRAAAAQESAPTPSPATPAPSASDPAPSSNLTPSKAAQLAKDPKVAATMPEASASASKSPSPSTATSKKAAADRGTKFRSRTAALKLTPTAVLRLRALMESDSGPKLIRVGVRNKGCAGMSYHLEYIKPEEAGRFDERVKQDGVEVLIDSKALFSIIGSEMDWQEDRLSAKFVFNNPNVKEACGCGESFLT
ncbi:hypothetical protein NDA16_000394 [Ustilago loliicola]|nr:hypothetical protein NDA16_000394 [Ustilago loliicola]